MNNIEAIKEKIKSGNLILFVGSGVSNHLGLPTWSQLVTEVANFLGYDEKIFKSLGGNLTLMEYYLIAKKSHQQEIAEWMQKNWGGKTIEKKVAASSIYQNLTTLDISEIYTTNYDHLLEIAFKKIKNKKTKKVVSSNDLLDLKKDQKAIIKFHGDYEFPATMVLGESQYFERLDSENPLDVKLKADLLTKSILYIGYSLSDINLRYITYKVNSYFKEFSEAERAKRESFIFLTRPNAIDEMILKKRSINVIVSEDHDPTLGLTKFLSDIVT